MAAWSLMDQSPLVLAVAIAVSAGMLARLLISAHHVGTGLRSIRQRHRDLLALLGDADLHTGVTVLEHESLTAYCVPGRGHHIVLSSGAITGLDSEGLRAVLAHERAHLNARHDIVLELFTVLHHAVPRQVRCEAALSEVNLLGEALADRAAMRLAGGRSLAEALEVMHNGANPRATLGAAASSNPTKVRLALIRDASSRHTGRATAMLCFAAGTVTLPFALVAVGV